jgi:GTPase SAR1 family protein
MEKIKTHGTDTKSIFISICGETTSKVKIWDTAGQETHANIVGSYAKRLDACLMVFDLTDANALDGIKKWIKQLN